MIIDHTLVFSDHQAITASAASTNLWDTLAVGLPAGWVSARAPDKGHGFAPIPLLVEVTEVFATLTSLKVAVQMDTTAAFSSPTIIAETEAIAAASLVAGYKFRMLAQIPEGATEQFIRLYYTVAGSDATTGKIFAAVTAGNQTNSW